jgi:ribosomal protein S18 acetylase RimI-like enzyme
MSTDAALVWRLETAFDAAWPCLQQMPVGSWLCKVAGGVSRRSNSANPQGPDAPLDADGLAAIANVYAAAGQPAYVRVLSVLDPEVDRLLDRSGWSLEGGTLTLTGPLDGAAPGGAELAPAPSPEWLAALNAINGRGPEASAAFAAILARLKAPAAFAAVRREGRIASAAYGALHDGWLCIEAVATDPGFRGQGLASDLTTSLMAWGRARGAQGACLQVSADNAAGRALYRKLGVGQEAYGYHYRRGPFTESGA